MVNYPRAGKEGFKRWIPSFKLFLGLVVCGFLGVVTVFAIAVAVTPIPEPNDVAKAERNIVYWNDGKTEIGRIGEANRVSIPLSEVPEKTQQAVLAAEDREYFDHGGFNPMAIGRATWNQLRGETGAGGASTITQQYAKNAFLSQEQTIVRKVRELVLSVKLELVESKSDILSNYLNTIYFGRGAYGIETASLQFFGKPASELSLNQSVALAAMIQQPGNLDPEKNPEALLERMNYVADGMLDKGWITPRQRERIRLPKFEDNSPARNAYKGTKGYLLDAVRRQMLEVGYTEEQVDLGGYRIVSTFDKKAQDSAVAAVNNSGLTQTKENGLRIGLSSVVPSTGEVWALYGGTDYLKNQFSNADQAIALGGSTFKAYTLAAAFEDNIPVNSTWNGNSPMYQGGVALHNEGNASYGTISLIFAAERSVNTAFVQMGNQVGPKNVVDAAVRAGLPESTVGLVADSQTTLGTAAPTPLTMASSYATFANQGQRVAPTTIKSVARSSGRVEYEHLPEPTEAFTPDIANTVNYTLGKVVTNGTGSTAQGLGRPAAGKTGTTDNNRSAWFSGYTPNLSTAVALSRQNPDGSAGSLIDTGFGRFTGGGYPASIWTSYMSGALDGVDVEEFELPAQWPGGYDPMGGWSPPPVNPSPTEVPTQTPSGPTGSPSVSPSGSPTPSASPLQGNSVIFWPRRFTY